MQIRLKTILLMSSYGAIFSVKNSYLKPKKAPLKQKKKNNVSNKLSIVTTIITASLIGCGGIYYILHRENDFYQNKVLDKWNECYNKAKKLWQSDQKRLNKVEEDDKTVRRLIDETKRKGFMNIFKHKEFVQEVRNTTAFTVNRDRSFQPHVPWLILGN